MAKPSAGIATAPSLSCSIKLIIASAAGNRAEFSSPIENFKDGASIISEPAHNPNIDIDISSQTAGAKIINQLIEFSAATAFFQDRQNWIGKLAELLSRLIARLALGFVDRLQHFLPSFARKFLLLKKIGPKFPVADADHEILCRKAERAEDVDTEGDQFDICGKIAFANDIAIELEMFAQSAALLFFVTEELPDRKPLQRFLELAFMRGDDPRKRRRQFRAQRDFAFAFVDEIEKLADDFIPAFLFDRDRLVQAAGHPIRRSRSGGQHRASAQKCNSAPRNRPAENREIRVMVA